jgi:hypothetical protein
MKKLLLCLLVGCHPAQELTAPPPPLRPAPEPVPVSRPEVARDCEPLRPGSELNPIDFNSRSPVEARRLAEKAKGELRTAESAEVERTTREQYITEAVVDFITALGADPYNITATYNLAAAYARIGRKQCSINLLTRLLQMRSHPSRHAEVELHIDRLLGRKQGLDPDFAEMRRDERFRSLIAKMCEGSSDPSCVYGGAKKP